MKLDLDGSGWDVDEDRSHNKANELEERDIASGPTHSLAYDPVGNLIDDGKAYKYQYDAFGRLRRMFNQNDELVAEYVYNGLGHRIGVHYDVNADGQVDQDDVWYWFAYDERWRIVATYRGDDTSSDPKEVFVYYAAGLGGYGGSSYIDAVILRDRDANTAWDAASDGVLEERIYHCQNWRHDVVALITEAGHQVQQMRYSAYGIPIGLPAGDVNSDGSVTSTDYSIVSTWVGASHYDVRGDINLDGVIDNTDRTLVNALVGNSLGWGALSLEVDASGGGNRKGYAGYEGDFSRDGFWHVRFRVLDSELGRWTRRDPLGYVDGVNTYSYVSCRPLGALDPFGLQGKYMFRPLVFGAFVSQSYSALTGLPWSGLFSRWRGSISLSLPSVFLPTNSISASAFADSRGWASSYLIDGLWSDYYAMESSSVTVNCDPNTGLIYIAAADGQKETDSFVFASATLSVSISGQSVTITAMGETGFGAIVAVNQSYGWHVNTPAGGFTYNFGTTYTYTQGKSFQISRTRTYKCECE